MESADGHVDVETSDGMLWAAVVGVSALGAIGVPYWTAPLQQVAADGVFGLSALIEVVLVVAAFVACTVAPRPWWTATALLGVVPVAALGRIVMDLSADLTSHSLWPLELATAVFISVPAVGAGALLAFAVRRMRRLRAA